MFKEKLIQLQMAALQWRRIADPLITRVARLGLTPTLFDLLSKTVAFLCIIHRMISVSARDSKKTVVAKPK